MNRPFQFGRSPSALRSKWKSPLALLVVISAMSSIASAQGTATGPVTSHDVEAGPIVHIGDPLNPIPIDLDPLGPPWTKAVGDPGNFVPGVAILDMIESIQNVGMEPWGDWHEHILPPPAGFPPSFWTSVVGLSVNGNPIGFSAMGVGTQDLWLDDFTQPVLPGDILQIHKQVQVDGNVKADGGPLLRLLEYPTPVPEPSTVVLLAVGCLFLLNAIRKR